MSRSAKLTSTSYAVLGLLCLRPWSAYDLARQVERGWGDIWPRATRGIYEEPKKLVAHDFATSRTERTGQRSRTVYEANDRGRRTLRVWLAQQPAPPAFESEALVQVVFADHGSLGDLRQAIDSIRNHATQRSAALRLQGEDYLETGGPFPGRMHLLHLVGGFLAEQHAAMLRWADWAEAQIVTWESTHGPAEVGALGHQVAGAFAANLHGRSPTR